jgi:hypothetical protein
MQRKFNFTFEKILYGLSYVILIFFDKVMKLHDFSSLITKG